VTVLNVPPDLTTPTGATASVLVDQLGAPDVLVFRGRDAERRSDEFEERLRASSLIHWHLNLGHHSPALAVARTWSGRIPQIGAVHHVGNGNEHLVEALSGTVDVIHVMATDVAEQVSEFARGTQIEVLPHATEGWDRSRRPRERHVPRIGWCGNSERVGDRKNLHVLLEALDAVQRAGRPVEVLVQGRIPIETLDLARRRSIPVRFQPWVRSTRRLDFYNKIDLYVSPSTVEGGPLPVLEAIARGCPAAFTRTGVGRDLLEAGVGVELSMHDPAAQAETISTLLAEPAALALAGLNMRERARPLVGPGLETHYVQMWKRWGASHDLSSIEVERVDKWNELEQRIDAFEEVRILARRGRRRESLARMFEARTWGADRTRRWEGFREIAMEFVRNHH